MTTIAAIQGDGWVVMGGDTQSTVAEYKRLVMSNDKVINNNGILIAGCGMGRGMDLLQKAWKAPKPRPNQSIAQLDAWMAKTFIPGMRKLFIEGGYDMKDDGDYAQHEGAFIVAVQGVVFYIDDDYSFDREARGITASGSGGDFATGSLYGKDLSTIDAACDAMRTAIDAARAYDVYSGGETRIYVQEA